MNVRYGDSVSVLGGGLPDGRHQLIGGEPCEALPEPSPGEPVNVLKGEKGTAGKRGIRAGLEHLLDRHLSPHHAVQVKQLLGSRGLLFVYNRLGAVFIAAAGLLAARWMGPLEYGKVGLITNMANVALVPLLVGANNSMYKFLPDADRAGRTRSGRWRWSAPAS